ncbi:hypothetical protein Lal_00013744 [Lupinus albus]|nr:hypothetical protein Lal_00013744 [Lupinus albus]
MASSSRAKKQRTSVATKKQGTSSSEANPLDFARLLANEEQRKVFTEHFLGRPIFAPKYGNGSNFELDYFHFPHLLRKQNLFAFCEESNAYYPELVRVFYYNLNLRKNRLISSLKGKEIILDMQTFSSICGETVKNRDIIAVGNLNLEDRLLHNFLSYVIMPMFSNHSQINDIELQLMYALKHNLEINWALTLMRHMWSVRETYSPLPYAIIISKILEHFGVLTVGESKITLNARDVTP